MSDDIKFDTKKLDKIIKALGDGDAPMGFIGVMGSNSAREEGELNNATIGLKHEFGDRENGLVIRSFLRMPLTRYLNRFLVASKAFDKAALAEVVAQGTVTPWLKKVMIVAEQVVQEAFNTGGFGQWKVSNMAFKKNHQTLVETQQLRNSITSEVHE